MIEHTSWDSRIFDKLDTLSLTANDTPDLAQSVGQVLQRYGFCLVNSASTRASRDSLAGRLHTLCSSLGQVVPQSPRGELVEDVRDYSDEEQDERGYRSRGELSPHSDPPSIIALHCLQPAMSGGESSIVCVRSIHDRLEQLRPDLLDVLYQEFPVWLVAGHGGNKQAKAADYGRPVFSASNGLVSCAIYRPFIELAARALEQPLSDKQFAALDLFEQCAHSPDLALRFHLRPGQTLFLHNRIVLHARTDYVDWPEKHRRRHLLRVWIDSPGLLPIPSVHQFGDLFSSNKKLGVA